MSRFPLRLTSTRSPPPWPLMLTLLPLWPMLTLPLPTLLLLWLPMPTLLPLWLPPPTPTPLPPPTPATTLAMPPWPLLKQSEENDQTYATHTTRLHSEKKSDGTRCATSDGNKDFIDNF